MSKLSKLETVLKDNGHSITGQRKQVFDALEGNEALSMKEVVEAVSNKVDRASVYRIIDLFTSLGIVNQVHIGWKYKLELSDGFSDHHHHIVCVKCQKVETLMGYDRLEESIVEIARDVDYQLTKHSMELAGICKNCQD